MTPVGFEPKTPEDERPQTYALDRAASGIGLILVLVQSVTALCYKQVDRGFDSQWRHWNFLLS